MRKVDELAYADLIAQELPRHDHLGELVREKLVYYPTVTREPFRNQGRLPELIANGKLCRDLGFPQIDPSTDRAMICGGPAMLKDMRMVLDQAGFTISAGIGPATTSSSARSSRSDGRGAARADRHPVAAARLASKAFAERDTGFLPSTSEM